MLSSALAKILKGTRYGCISNVLICRVVKISAINIVSRTEREASKMDIGAGWMGGNRSFAAG